MNRLRIRFRRGAEIKYISHLDIIRVWIRAFRRAGIEPAYSEGFNPHPRISLAAPLATGVTGDAELMDVYIGDAVSPHNFTAAVNRQMPAGMEILNTYQVDCGLPALQAQLTAAEYAVEIAVEEGIDRLGQALTTMLEKEQFPWQHERDTGIKSYDLRPLIEELWLESFSGNIAVVGMRLVCDNRGSGRPEQVIKALGFERPLSIHRTRLILKTS
jgi:radical SAM-linked protein